MDPDKVAEGSTFRAHVDVTEWLGDQQYAYIPFEAPPEVQEQLTQLARDLDGESLRTQLVVSLDSASSVPEGEEIELYINAAKMHLFDPATGENLTVTSSRDTASRHDTASPHDTATPRDTAPARAAATSRAEAAPSGGATSSGGATPSGGATATR